MKKKGIILLILIILIAVAAWLTWQFFPRKPPNLTLYGNVDIRTVDLSFRVGGRLQTQYVDEGDSVKPGMLLSQLDPQPQQISLMNAQANVANAQASLDLLNAGYRSEEIAQVEAAMQQQESAYRYADSFYLRQAALVKSGAISANELDNARTARNQARANLQAANDKLAQYRKGNRPQEIAQAQAMLKQAQAQRAQAELDLKDAVLYSPSAGTILTRVVEPGSMLSAGSTVLSLSLTSPVWIRTYVSETQLSQAQPGRTVLIYTDSRPDRPYHGKIGFVSPSAEFTPKTVETADLRTHLVYRLRIIVNDADASLRQGMPVTLTLAEPANE